MRWGLLIAAVLIAALGLLLMRDPLVDRTEDRRNGPESTLVSGTSKSARSADARSRSVLFGRVTRRGESVAARVELRALGLDPHPLDEPPDSPMEAAAADPESGFRFENLEPGTYEIRAIAEDGAIGAAVAVIERSRAHVRKDVPLAVGPHTLRARVRWGDGTAFEGRVVVGDRRIATDSAGRFEVPGLDTGLVVLRFELPGRFRSGPREIWLPDENDLDLTVGLGWKELTGRVVSAVDDRPIAGAVLTATLWSRSMVTSRSRAVSGEAGEYRLGSPAGRGTMTVTAPGFADWHGSFEHGSMDRLEVRLLPAATLHGVVRRADDGTPVPGVVVRRPGGRRNRNRPVEAVTDGDGRYRFERAEPGRWSVHVFGGGWMSKGLLTLDRDGFDPNGVHLRHGETVERRSAWRAGSRSVVGCSGRTARPHPAVKCECMRCRPRGLPSGGRARSDRPDDST